MIASTLIVIGSTVLAAIVGFMPDSTGFSAETQAWFQSLAGYTQYFTTIVAIDVAFNLILAYIAFELLLVSIAFARWVIRMIPFIGGKV